MCDDVRRTLAMTNVWVVAVDRALTGFFMSVKTQTFNDLTHVGLVAVIVMFAACLAVHVAAWVSRLSTQHAQLQKERGYESDIRHAKAQSAVHIT